MNLTSSANAHTTKGMMGPGARRGDKPSKMPMVFQLCNSILVASIQTKSVPLIHAKIVLSHIPLKEAYLA